MQTISKSDIQKLLELQDIEANIIRIRAQLNLIPEKQTALAKEIAEIETQLNGEAATLDEMKKRYRMMESDHKANLVALAKSRGKLNQAKTNKEYRSGLKEIEELEAANSRLEDDMLELLDQIETGESRLAVMNTETDQKRLEEQTKQAELTEEAASLTGRLDSLTAAHEKAKAGFSPELLQLYSSVRKRVGVNIIVPVRNFVCQGCNLNIPPQTYNELHRDGNLRFCSNCQRIIFVETDVPIPKSESEPGREKTG
jgi:hypothetical protein